MELLFFLIQTILTLMLSRLLIKIFSFELNETQLKFAVKS